MAQPLGPSEKSLFVSVCAFSEFWIPHPFVNTLLHLHGEGPSFPVHHGVSQLAAQSTYQNSNFIETGTVMMRSVHLLQVSHRVILILPFYLGQIHTAVVGLPSLLAISVLNTQAHVNTHACTDKDTDENETQRLMMVINESILFLYYISLPSCHSNFNKL